MATLTNIIKVRGRDVLHFANGMYILLFYFYIFLYVFILLNIEGEHTRNLSQFWVGYVKDRKSLSRIPISSLKDEIFEYALKVGEQV